MTRVAAMILASAGSGIAAGATGMYLYLRDRRKKEASSAGSDTEMIVESSPRSLQPPAQANDGSAIASDFIMPFVKRYGFPDLDQVILPSEEYTSCWDSRTRNARWVVERINLNTVSGPGDRKKSPFRPDSRLQPLFRSGLSDFYASGYDRGHLAPAGDHKTTQANLTQTFLLSNMAPQEPSFNRGYWSDFEEFVRTLVVPSEKSIKVAEKDGFTPSSSMSPPFKDIYVVTGPLFLPSKEAPVEVAKARAPKEGAAIDADQETDIIEVKSSSSTDPAAPAAAAKWVVKHDIIGNPMKMVAVPTHFFKVIIAEPYPPPPSEALYSNPTTFVAAFAMPNTTIPNNTDLRNFLVPLEALESVSGLRFLGAMDAADAPGAPASATSGGSSGEEAAIKEFLDQEAIRLRAKAGVPALSGDWGRVGVEKKGNHSGKRSGGNGKRPQLSIGGADGEGRTRVFRHLCNTTSCRGL